MTDICKNPMVEYGRNKPFFEILRLHYLKFQIPTAYGLKYFFKNKIFRSDPKWEYLVS